MKKLFCISISYKQAALAVREKLAFSREVQCELLKRLWHTASVSQCVLLCTCNRTEVYFCGTSDSWSAVRRLLAEYSDMEEEELASWLRLFQGEKAARHLFQVASGMDSMVMGEDEILGQTRHAYTQAVELGTVSYELHRCFQGALNCAKGIKTKTAISRTSVSVATLAANEAARMGDKVQVLVIGATGKIGQTVVKNLLSHKNVQVIVTLRQHGQEQLVPSGAGVRLVDYGERYGWMDEADCIISATTSPHYTVTLHELRQVLVHEKPRLFLDLAVPPDVESTVETLPLAKRMDMDDFQQLAQVNHAMKQDSVAAANALIAEELDILEKELRFHEFLPQLERVKANLENQPLETVLYQLKSRLRGDQFGAVLDVLEQLGGA